MDAYHADIDMNVTSGRDHWQRQRSSGPDVETFRLCVQLSLFVEHLVTPKLRATAAAPKKTYRDLKYQRSLGTWRRVAEWASTSDLHDSECQYGVDDVIG